MTRHHPLALVAGGATLLAALPLSTVFQSFTWLLYCFIAVGFVVATAIAVRSARGPVWVQVPAMLAALLLFVTVLFRTGHEIGGLIPSAATFQHFGELLGQSVGQIRDESIPVPDRDGLLLLTTLGIGLVAVMVDFFAVGIRRPALAGLPMLAIYSVPVAVLPEGLSFLAFGFAAAGYLWLLVSDRVDLVRAYGRRFSGDGRSVDPWEPSPLASAGRRLGVLGMLVALFLPLAIPATASGLLDRFSTTGGNGGRGGPGPGGATVDLSAYLTGNLVRNEVFPMVRVRTTDPSPYYLRFGVSDQAGSAGFSNRPPNGGVSVTAGLPGYNPPDVPGVSSRRYQAEIEIVSLDMRLAPAYQQVVAVQGLDGSWFFDGPSNQIFSRRSSISNARYSVEYVRTQYSQAALRSTGPFVTQDPDLSALASVPQVPEVTDLVQQLTSGTTTEYDAVRALFDYFVPSNGFGYSLTAPRGSSGNAIVDFLFESRRGYCVQYAAALTWLVRAAGFPARVAFGFTRGSGATNGVYTLTNFNLHAWTEVYFPTFGWVPFDATPVSAIAGSVPTPWAPDPANPGVVFPTEGPDVPGNPSAGPTGSISPGPTIAGAGGGSGGGLLPLKPLPLIGAFAVVVLLALAITPGVRRRGLRRRRLALAGRERSPSGTDAERAAGQRAVGDGPSGRPVRAAGPTDTGGEFAPRLSIMDAEAAAPAIDEARRAAHAAWAELIDSMIDYDVAVEDSETPRATARRLAELPDLGRSAAAAARLVALVEEWARYARRPLQPVRLDNALRTVRAAFIDRSTWRQRLRAAVLPQSVLLGWRAGYLAWISRTVVGVGRIREALAAISPRRLLPRSQRF